MGAYVFWSLSFCLAVSFCVGTLDKWNDLRLPTEHMPFIFNKMPSLKQECIDDPECPYKDALESDACWGYEKSCPVKNRLSDVACPQNSPAGWAKNKAEQKEKFWGEGDFGYVKNKKDSLMTICKAQKKGDSALKCSKHTQYCRAKNLYMDLTDLKSKGSRERYRENVFKPGQIGGHCKMDRAKLAAEGDHKSPLQSWYAELQEYDSLPFKPLEDDKCDIIYEGPTILMKLDAGVNMYHHFCDFVNLYASQHLNNSFDVNTRIIMWDTSEMQYGDFFHVSWKAFSNFPYVHLKELDGKKVCIKDAVFPLLPRMRYGLYYNMPLIPGCQGSSLFKAFAEHFLHRMNITQDGPLKDKIRITLLSRSTKFRKILNQDEIVKALEAVPEYEFKVVDFKWDIPFTEQLKITANSDMFMGMHGAGLTHMLFQPDWGTIFEIYNCEDNGCYSDLARLRGLTFLTWENHDKLIQEDEGHHPTLGAHAKFTNYSFDVEEFLRMVAKGVAAIRKHPSFIKAWRKKHGSIKEEL